MAIDYQDHLLEAILFTLKYRIPHACRTLNWYHMSMYQSKAKMMRKGDVIGLGMKVKQGHTRPSIFSWRLTFCQFIWTFYKLSRVQGIEIQFFWIKLPRVHCMEGEIIFKKNISHRFFYFLGQLTAYITLRPVGRLRRKCYKVKTKNHDSLWNWQFKSTRNVNTSFENLFH